MAVTPIDNVLIKRDDSAHGTKVSSALIEAATLCFKSSHEAKELLTFALSRFRDARDALHTAMTTTAAKVEAATFVQALKAFGVLLRLHSRSSLAERVVDHLKLVSQLEQLLGGSDGLETVIKKLPGPAVVPWKEPFTSKQLEYKDALSVAIDALVLQVQQDLLKHAPLVAEAISVFEKAKETRDSSLYSGNALVKKMEPPIKQLATEIATRPDGTITIPSGTTTFKWYIPKHKVDYASKSFANGSFGSVHEGMWGSGTRVVVKELLADSYIPVQMQPKFIEEADLWSQLMHPYVAKLWGACHNASPPFMVCEDATRNGNLSTYLSISPLNRQRRWRLLLETALGIEYLHDKNIIHGDLKLTNVLVGDDGYARVADFGLSRLKKSSSAYATVADKMVTTSCAGALRWRAPECADGALLPRKESDVYSFAMCIYEAFALTPPFIDQDDISVENLIAEGTLPDTPSNMSAEEWQLVQQIAQKDPAQRPTIEKVVEQILVFVTRERNDELKAIVVCKVCSTKIPLPPSGNSSSSDKTTRHYCGKCLKTVDTKPFDENEAITINSAADLPRVVELLASGTDGQKINATGALKNYVFGDPAHQREVHKARAIAVLIKLVKRSDERDNVQLDALLTLGCIVVGHTDSQENAQFEDVIPRLEALLDASSSPLSAKAAMVLGYLAYGNETNREKIINGPGDVLSKIRALASSGSVEKERAATKALALLDRRAPIATAAGSASDQEYAPAA